MSDRSTPANNLTRSWLLKILVPLNGCKELLSRPLEGSALAESLSLQPEPGKAESENHGVSSNSPLPLSENFNDWDNLINGRANLMPRHKKPGDKKEDAEPSTQAVFNKLVEMYRASVSSKETGPEDASEDILEHNLRKFGKLFLLNEPATAILRFAVMIKTDDALQEALALLDGMNPSKFIHAMSVLLEVPGQRIREEMTDTSRLIQRGIMEHRMSSRHGYRSWDMNSWLDFCDESLPEKLRYKKLTRADILRQYATLATTTELTLENYQRVSQEVDVLLEYLGQTLKQSQQRGVNIFIQGFAGTGKTELAKLVAQTLKVPLYMIAQEDEDDDPIRLTQRLKYLLSAQDMLSGHEAILVMDECEEIFHQHPFTGLVDGNISKAWINRVLEENKVPTLWISNQPIDDPAFVRRFDLCIALGAPGKQERKKVIRAFGSKIGLTSELDFLAKSRHLTPAVIENAVAVVARTNSNASAEQKASAVNMVVGNTLQAQGLPAPSGKSGSVDLGYDPGLCAASEKLDELVPALAREKSGRLLLHGPPGAGKTAFGLWLGDQLSMTVEQMNASDLISPLVGVTEQNFARAFRSALKQDAILQIDEMDSFLQDRRHAQRSWEVSQVNEMLSQMSDFAGIFIATTNFNTHLDQASLRRFDMKIELTWLQPEGARLLLEKACNYLKLGKPSAGNLEAVGQLCNLMPGDFATVCRKGKLVDYAGCGDLLAALHEECEAKEAAPRKIGFL